ncbi:MAG: urease accessory UreF family protein [Burkholderiaceae bacterium]
MRDREAPPGAAEADLLLMLQLSDSMFPSGATAFSWGVESMHEDGVPLKADALRTLMTTLVERRWAGFDRPFLERAWREQASGSAPMPALIDVDRRCEAMNLTEGARAASRRLGFTQLRVHAELGGAAAGAYLAEVREGRAPGHLPIVQGLVWADHGLSLRQAGTMSAYGLGTAVAGAAMRLGLIGHVDAQRLLSAVRAVIVAVLAEPCPDVDDAWTGAPALDIAAMRHEPRTGRLFAT